MKQTRRLSLSISRSGEPLNLIRGLTVAWQSNRRENNHPTTLEKQNHMADLEKIKRQVSSKAIKLIDIASRK